MLCMLDIIKFVRPLHSMLSIDYSVATTVLIVQYSTDDSVAKVLYMFTDKICEILFEFELNWKLN